MKSEDGRMRTSDWKALASELRSLLNLQWSPVAITFSEDVPVWRTYEDTGSR